MSAHLEFVGGMLLATTTLFIGTIDPSTMPRSVLAVVLLLIHTLIHTYNVYTHLCNPSPLYLTSIFSPPISSNTRVATSPSVSVLYSSLPGFFEEGLRRPRSSYA